MANEVMEEELLRSIEEVDVKIQNFRKKVRALLADIQAEGQRTSQGKNRSGAT
jgi:hypothetical protein